MDLHQVDELAETPQDTLLTCPLPGLKRPRRDLVFHYKLNQTASVRPSGPPVYEIATLFRVRPKNPELEAESNLYRCMSDASLVKRRRGGGKSAAQREKERQHRFSINGHFYNYKVAVH